MHRRGRRQRDLRPRIGDVAQEHELIKRQRPRAIKLFLRIGRGELDRVTVVVAKLEHRRLDHEAIDPLDEPTPIRAAPELAVGDDRKAGILLQADHVANAPILKARELGVINALGEVILERLAQGGGAQQAADMVGAERRTGLRAGEHSGFPPGTEDCGPAFYRSIDEI